ncbi:hypothetical protein NHH73_21670 [Oxalobacteraceae bacterium OTU3CINTB1]|nr:hypothetical protein NHH73_21670 [Oxalobacteraceae bacterium OTU3CINTB1]
MTTNPIQLEIEALADGLSASADALHTRLMRELRQKPPGIAQATAQALFDNEVALRQHANSLYLEAAVLAASGLAGAQQQLLDVTARAQEKIRKIQHTKDLIALTGELLSLAAAIATGKPDKLAKPFETIKHHLEAMDKPAG